MITTLHSLPVQRKTHRIIYLLIVLLTISALATLPFVTATISVKSKGIVRPATERTEIRPVLTGVVEQLFYKEGDSVSEGATIATLRDDLSPVQTVSNNYDINQRRQFIQDLKILTSTQGTTSLNSLTSQLYRQQLNRYQYQLADQRASLKKVQRELDITNKLLNDKVIAPKEAFDKQVEGEKLNAAYEAFARTQIAQWQQELATYRAELSQLNATGRRIQADRKNFLIKAPVCGVLQGINNLYEGSVVQVGQSIASVSPQTSLIAECYVNTKDIGLLKTGQRVRFQVDAFDYNYFGTLTGRIASIDNDFMLVDEVPVFKVRCSFDSTQLRLKDGFTGQLKKGLTLQARFVVAERTLWQLLFDKIDDWLNPSAPHQTNITRK